MKIQRFTIVGILSILFIFVTQIVQAEATNRAPIASNLFFTTTANVNLTVAAGDGLLINAYDPDGDALSLIKGADPTNGTVLLVSDGGFYYIPNEDYVGTDSFTYQVNDGQAYSNTATVTVTVNQADELQPIQIVNLFAPPLLEGMPAGDWYNLVVFDANEQVIFDGHVNVLETCDSSGCTTQIDLTGVPVDLNTGMYHWRLTSYQGDTPVDTRDSNNAFVNAPALPMATVMVNDAHPQITWNNDANATWYQVYVGGANGSYTHMQWYESASLCNATTCAFSAPGDFSTGNYEVYLQAWGPGGYSVGGIDGWSGPFNFTIENDVPTLVTNMNANDSVISWAASAGATWYQVWVGAEGHTAYQAWLSASDLNCANDGMCSLPLQLSAGAYTWYVQAYGPGGITTDGIDGWVEGPAFSIVA